jgi:hypothetical protein
VGYRIGIPLADGRPTASLSSLCDLRGRLHRRTAADQIDDATDLSVRGITEGRQAYQRDMFGDLGLDHAVYSAAERAIHSAELATAIRDLRPDAVPSDRILLEDARAQIRAITQELSAVEATLKRGAKAADKLSERIVEPERQRAAETARETAAAAAKERRDQACSRLEEVCARADTALGVQHDGVEERIVAVAAATTRPARFQTRRLGTPHK